MKQMKYKIGYCDYEGKGPVNMGEVEWSLENGCFYASGGIWNSRKGHARDYVVCGQCLDTLVEYFPTNELLKRIHAVWERWHLNDMKAGSPRQRAFLRGKEPPSGVQHYSWAIEQLTHAVLQPDAEYLHNGKPYSYGSAWLTEELPQEVVDEINSWSAERSEERR